VKSFRLPATLAALLMLPTLPACAPAGSAAVPDRVGPAARILSLNPCVDALLHELSVDERILAISHYSHDPRATSVPLYWARRFPVTGGTAEEVIAVRPDLVIAGPHVAPATVAMLERLGIGVMLLPVPQTVQESVAQVRELGAALGAESAAEALARRIEAAIAASEPADDAQTTALIWQAGGMVPGRDTMVGDMMRLAGLSNLSAMHGLADWDVLGLERLIAQPPELLLGPTASRLADDRMLAHPAVARLGGTLVQADFPARLMHCGGPTIIEASMSLAAGRRQAAQQ
jgi:iron complex transport system substrate-binding protein